MIASAELPTREQLDEARWAMSNSYAEVEAISWRLRDVAEAYNRDGVTPPGRVDEAYVGALYRFVDDVDTEAEQLTRMVETLKERLRDVDLMGRDCDVRAERAS